MPKDKGPEWNYFTLKTEKYTDGNGREKTRRVVSCNISECTWKKVFVNAQQVLKSKKFTGFLL